MEEVVRSGESRTLGALATRINEEHRACVRAVVSAVQHAIAAGEQLLEAKERAGHGNWGDWLRENFEGSERHAQRYMQIASRKDELNPTHVSDMSLRGALRELSAPADDATGNTTAGDSERLRELEAVAGVDDLDDLLAKGRALAQIEESELYKAAGYRTFSRYCSDRLRITRSTASALLSLSDFQGLWPGVKLTPVGIEGIPDDLDFETWKRGLDILTDLIYLLPQEEEVR